MQTYDVSPLGTCIRHQRGEPVAGRQIESAARSRSSRRVDNCESGKYGWGEMFRLHHGALAEIYEWRVDTARQDVLAMSDCFLALYSLSGSSRLTVDGHDSISTNEPHCVAVLARQKVSVARKFEAGYGQEIAVLVPLIVLERCGSFQTSQAGTSCLASVPMSDRMIESARAIFSLPVTHPLRDACIESHAWLLLSELLSTSVFHPTPCSTQAFQCRTRILASRAAELLRAKPESNHTLDSVARTVGLSRSRLAEVFHQQYGTTVQAFLREVRMEKASKLIRSGQLAISEIALRVGYQDVSSFTRTFHRFHRVTPAAMRRQHAA